MKDTEVIKRPLMSSKAMAHKEFLNQYTFEVALDAHKDQIRDAVERLFKVKVSKVRTLIMHGEIKRVQRGTQKAPNWKKAIISLRTGQSIDYYAENTFKIEQ